MDAPSPCRRPPPAAFMTPRHPRRPCRHRQRRPRPSGLGAPPLHLPLFSEAARRRRHVFVPADHRFKAAARFLQALWREDRGLPIGTHLDRGNPHRVRRLGSRISLATGRTGGNFMTPNIAAVAARALAYREPGAAYDISRLRTNLLSSQPLAFNLFAPLSTDPALAARFIAELVPTAQLATVTDILFEHSPGRGDRASPPIAPRSTSSSVAATARRAGAHLHRDEVQARPATTRRPRPTRGTPRLRVRRPAYSLPLTTQP